MNKTLVVLTVALAIGVMATIQAEAHNNSPLKIWAAVLRARVHNSNLMAGQKFFVVMFKGQNLHVFFTLLKVVFWE
jgi:hypothetical protein